VLDVSDSNYWRRCDTAACVGSAGEGVAPARDTESLPTGRGVKMKCLELLERRDTEEGVSADEPVVEKPEGPLSIHRDKPEGELGHLNGEGVDVDAVKAVLGDQSACFQEDAFDLGIGGLGTALREDASCLGVALSIPGLDDTVGEEAAGGDEESSAAHGDVCYAECK
jgi:hypothetical protein